MTNNLSYEIKIGRYSIKSDSKESDRTIKSFACEHSMDGGCGNCCIELSDIENPVPQTGEDVVVKIDSGKGLQSVFKGKIDHVTINPTTYQVNASDSLLSLSKCDLQVAYEKASADTIAKDILNKAGISIGTVEKGPKFESYVLLHGPCALNHLKKLGRIIGFDIFSDGEGKANFCGSSTKKNTHTIRYGIDILEYSIKELPLLIDSLIIIGEGSAGTKGAEKYYWLPDDLKGVTGKGCVDNKGNVSSGKAGSFLSTQYSAIAKSKEVGDTIAKNQLVNQADRRFSGYLKVTGITGIFPGDRIKIDSLPKKHALETFFKSGDGLRVRRSRISLNTETGLITRLDF